MGVADAKGKGKGKEKETEKETEMDAQALKHLVEEEAPRARSEPEALEGGDWDVDFFSGYEVSPFPCAAHALNPDSEDEPEDVNSGEFELLAVSESGENDSQEQKLQAPGASLAGPLSSASMPPFLTSHGLEQLHSPSLITTSGVSMKPSVSLRIAHRSGSLGIMQRATRLGLPSKGRMFDGTLSLLKDCQFPVKRVNPRQYGAEITQLPNVQVWLQPPEDIVRQLSSGHLDIGIVGFDTFSEYGQGNEDLIIVHDALGYGDCRLSLAIPKDGTFEKINSVKELAQMPQWTEEEPLIVATGFTYLGTKFMEENGPKHWRFSPGKGALEAAPAMGKAHVILDLVSSGTTLRENNLKEIEGGTVLESQAVLVASRKSLVQREGVLDTTREILGRLEAHLKAGGQIKVTAYMRGSSAEEVAKEVLSQPLSLSGLQGPAVSPVFCIRDGKVVVDCYAIDICVPKEALHSSVQQLRAIGSSKVLTSQLTYIFDEETPRWLQLRSKLQL